MTGEQQIRALRRTDHEVLRVATHTTMNWRGRESFTYRDLDSLPHFSHYTDFRPQRGDFGFVAEYRGNATGVVWCLFLDASSPGYGYISDDVPELSLCVFSGYRRQGIGARLLGGALEAAQQAGVASVSLSVEAENVAASRLYAAAGFRRAPEALDAGTHVVDLGQR